VDESGDTDMFDKKGRPLPNVSNLFMIGLAIIDDPEDVRAKLDNLRNQFLADPYFTGVPSFQDDAKKTAIMLHAKDDIPEIRWKVFDLLSTIPVKVAVVIRRKEDMRRDAQSIFQSTGQKITDNIIYDNVVTMLFRYISHTKGDCEIKFAVKKKPRNAALLAAINSSQASLKSKGNRVTTRIKVSSEHSRNDACLQLTDYYLWALNRLYINQETRYIDKLKDNFNVILDVDDIRNMKGGELFTRHNPIELIKIMPVSS